MSLLSSKSHFWPAKVTSVHQFLLATTSSLSKGVKRQFCLLKRQFCPVMILMSKLANSVKKLHLSVKILHILGWNKTYASSPSTVNTPTCTHNLPHITHLRSNGFRSFVKGLVTLVLINLYFRDQVTLLM